MPRSRLLTPALTGISQTSAMVGSPPLTLTLSGSNFAWGTGGTVVQVNGIARPAKVINASQLTIGITASDLATAQTLQIAVLDPTTCNGPSMPLNLTVNNPSPTLDQTSPFTPANVLASSGAQNVSVLGTGFVPSSLVSINGSNRASYVGPTHLSIALQPADVASAGSIPITVVNGGPGGGTATANLAVLNPVPSITSLPPPSATAGGGAATLTINGKNFVRNSVVQVNSSSRTTTFGSASQLTASIPASDVATAGTLAVTVVNPTPGGGASASASFPVSPSPDFAMSLSAGTPSVVQTGSGSTNITVTSLNGFNGATGLSVSGVPSGVTASFSPTSVTPSPGGVATSKLTFSASRTAATGTFVLTITVNSGNTSHSTTLSLTVTPANPTPSISSISPTNVFAGGGDFTLTISGSGFVSTSAVYVSTGNSSSARTATFVNSTQLTVTVTRSDIANSGSQLSIWIANPAPGDGTSNTSTLNVQ